MKLALRRSVAFSTLALAGISAAVACANSDDAPASVPIEPSDAGVPFVDGSPPDGPTTIEGDAAPPTCSHAGWCETPLPDIELQFVDIWPFATLAFAMAADEAQGAKFMEWDGSSWSYIDDGTQNDVRNGPESVWAPSENEVYFTLADASIILGGTAAGQIIYHGVRGAPGAPWTWDRQELPCSTFDFGGAIWGSSSSDVWATSCGKIYHRQSSGDAGAAWTAAYVDNGVGGPLTLTHAAGTGPDDIWFSGERGSCLALFHKSATGIKQLADSTPGADPLCTNKGAFKSVNGTLSGFTAPAPGVVIGSLTALSATGPTVYSMLRVTALANGTTEFVTDVPPLSLAVSFGPAWASTPADIWVLGNSQVVLRAKNLWSDAGAYDYSTISINGAPNTQYLQVIRGVSDTNMWLGGTGLAFHKTTP